MNETKAQRDLCVCYEHNFTPEQQAVYDTCNEEYKRTIDASRRHGIGQRIERLGRKPESTHTPAEREFVKAFFAPLNEGIASTRAEMEELGMLKPLKGKPNTAYKARTAAVRAERREERFADPSAEYERRCKAISKKYNLARWVIDKMLNTQRDECPGCGRRISLNGIPRTVPAIININPKTQRPRGLFCLKCSNAIGLVEGNPDTLRDLATAMEDNFETQNPQQQENP